MDAYPEWDRLPAENMGGSRGTWTVADDYGSRDEIRGVFLGSGSSRRDRHLGHDTGTWAYPPERCSACRWMELLIFREEAEDGTASGRYLVVKCGVSDVPGETDRVSFSWALSPDEVIVALYTRQHDKRILTRPACTALARCSPHDESLRDAFRAAA